MRGLCRLHTCTMSLYVKKKKLGSSSEFHICWVLEPTLCGRILGWKFLSWSQLKMHAGTQYTIHYRGSFFYTPFWNLDVSTAWFILIFSFSLAKVLSFQWEEVILVTWGSHMDSQILNRWGLTSSHLMWVQNSNLWGRPDLLFPIHLCQSSLIPRGPFHLLAMLAWETSRWSLLFFLSFISKSPVLSSVLEQITYRDLSSLSDSTLWGLCQILWWAQLSSFVWTLSGSPLSTHPIPLCQVPITEENSTQDFSGHTRQKFRIAS